MHEFDVTSYERLFRELKPSCNKADMESLESLQRRASKIIVKSKCGTTSTYYLKFQSLEDRRNSHILG